ncbi:MAG TPA: ABC transporter ATP-binding protein [Methylomirabilota bacterium]|nr:ABC transporter ATP-binding protein [Methylomirabilota bacterium]
MTAVADGTLPAIEVDKATKRYDGRTVLRGISFRVAAGETFGLLGPNGAGKTTTVEMIEGYRRPDAGQISVLGEDPATAGRDHRSRVGLMLQGGGGVDPRMTAREVLRLHGRFHVAPRNADELLELVGLTTAARTRYRRLSGGEKQRLGLALALVGRPSLVVLDEPTAGMDVEGRTATRALLGQLRNEGVTILLTSHDLTDVERVADRIAIIDRGRVVALGAPLELSQAAFPVLRFRLDAPLSQPDVRALEERLRESHGRATLVEEGGGRYRLDAIEPTPPLVALIAAWCGARGALIVELRAGGGSLEERYVELIGATGEDDE